MSVTAPLLELFKVDKQLRGLRSRLEAAERFLTQQQNLLGEMDKQKTTLEAQLKQLKVSVATNEGEAARIEARMAGLRDQMNAAKTAKEYNAFLAELNNLKEQKGQYEDRGLEAVSKVEEVEKLLSGITGQFGERSGIVGKAKGERDTHESEIRDRVTELQKQRDTVAAAVPAKDRAMLEALIKLRGDEAMAAIEVIDRRNHEYSCGSCMMAVTIEVVSATMSGKLAHCPNCRCLLFAGEQAAEEEKPKKPRKTAKPKKNSKEEPAEPAST